MVFRADRLKELQSAMSLKLLMWPPTSFGDFSQPTRADVRVEALARLEDASAEADAVLVSFSALRPHELEQIEQVAARGTPPVVFFGDSLFSPQLTTLLERGVVHHLIRTGPPREGFPLDVEPWHLQRAGPAPSDYFGPGANTFETVVTRASQRHDVFESVRAFARKAGACEAALTLLVNACDELLTNAFFHGPVDQAGRPRYRHLPRTSEVELASHERVTFTCGLGDHRLGVVVRDSFGRIEASNAQRSFMKGLSRHLKLPSTGGVGIGIFQVFSMANALVVRCRPGQFCEVGAFLKEWRSYRGFAACAKSYHFFASGPGGVKCL